jgi:hypothetical protein
MQDTLTLLLSENDVKSALAVFESIKDSSLLKTIGLYRVKDGYTGKLVFLMILSCLLFIDFVDIKIG